MHRSSFFTDHVPTYYEENNHEISEDDQENFQNNHDDGEQNFFLSFKTIKITMMNHQMMIFHLHHMSHHLVRLQKDAIQ